MDQLLAPDSSGPSALVTYSFQTRNVMVTGATGGMGRAISSAFVVAGASVVMCDLADITAGESVAAELTEGGPGRASYQRVDVTNEDAVRGAVQWCAENYGRLDHAVNAAAIENETAPLHECSADAFLHMMLVNVHGMFFSMKHELAAMLSNPDHGHCTIVNIASTNSVRPQPNQPAYTAAKHAVLGLTRSAAIDYASHGIRINAICPGSIDTPMLRNAMERRGRNPEDVAQRLSLLGRFGTPNEIADAALWLSSSASSFTLGHALAVDAGYLAR
jgi:NAD(P)-dependent dehydrogenase (short-subunit alcohol dehydrogenase family)